MQYIENEISLKYDTVCLDASLPASHFYEKRGYQTRKHERWNVENGVVLVYEVMERYYQMSQAPFAMMGNTLFHKRIQKTVKLTKRHYLHITKKRI